MTLWLIILLTSLASFGISALSGKWLVPFLHKLKFGQPIKVKDGPEWHAKKQGTPTMGGFMFILSTVLASMGGYMAYRIWAGIDSLNIAATNRFKDFSVRNSKNRGRVMRKILYPYSFQES